MTTEAISANFNEPEILTEEELLKSKIERIEDGICHWVTYWRCNPARFVTDVLNVTLKPFQMVLLTIMFSTETIRFDFVASRGLGKTFLTALYLTTRCILYPGTKAVVASGTKEQGLLILLKIKDELMMNFGWGSDILRNEINLKESSFGVNRPVLYFKNGSWIKVVTSNDNARGERANLLFVDEVRMVKENTIQTVLEKFLTNPRQPGYMQNPKYAHLAERNIRMFATSAWYAADWTYGLYMDYYKSMRKGKKSVAVSIPYQMAIETGLLMRADVEDDMASDRFVEAKWMMEMEGLFYGQIDDAVFSYKVLAKQRTLSEPLYPLWVYENSSLKIPAVTTKARRILSVDIALLGSEKRDNDATAIIINNAVQVSDTDFISNIVYIENYIGMVTSDLTLTIMRTFYEYGCTDLVIDRNGPGAGVFDDLMEDRYDPKTNKIYKAFRCCNDKILAQRCKVKDANCCMWAIAANAALNDEALNLTRNRLSRGKINLLLQEFEGEEYLQENITGYRKMEPADQAVYKQPYAATTNLIDEMVNLDHETVNGRTKVKEKSGMRKDNYSSLSYNEYVLNEIKKRLRPRTAIKEGESLASRLLKRSKRATFNSMFDD